jgi:adrenodoxin-NADP+ reductase
MSVFIRGLKTSKIFKAVVNTQLYSTASKVPLDWKPKVCIVGSGPAALYSAQYILKCLSNNVNVDIYEKLPVPFGLVRYGVAPDHQDVKNVINSFTETLRSPNVQFYGNINIGQDLKTNELMQAYDCVVLAYGSLSENYLNIPGEKSYENFISAKDFVGWYNGFPENENFKINLKCKSALIIGAGNVALDIARILLSPIDKLKQTDITDSSLEKIKNENQIENVTIVARRGILNAAFTLKELREITKLETIDTIFDVDDFKSINVDGLLTKFARPRRRLTEYMSKLVKKNNDIFNKKGEALFDI